ncbi:MAG: MFS transporter [Acidobacteriota bacterium]|nr:MFS transporter [Acidobacteriota bacterium]
MRTPVIVLPSYPWRGLARATPGDALDLLSRSAPVDPFALWHPHDLLAVGAAGEGTATTALTPNRITHQATSIPAHRWLRSLPLYVGFAASGIGVALPGATLPALLLRWRLNDVQAGELFLFAWIGSSFGSLAIHGSLRSCLVFGCALVSAGGAGLAFASGSHIQANLWMAAFGAGLGMTMTSISLLRRQQAERTGTELIRLNFIWALGACLCPTLAERALRVGDLRPLLGGLATLFALLALWTAGQHRLAACRADTRDAWTWAAIRKVPLPLVLMIMLITGIEASAGGWLGAYSRRSGAGLAATIAAPTCLWAGLLLSRLLWVPGSRRIRPPHSIRGSVLVMAAGAALLVARSGGWSLGAAAFLLGVGLGPIYPMLLAAVLQFTRTGGIFFLAGVGAACLPWLTGLVAAAHGSLRAGLLVPVGATLLLLALAWITPSRTLAASAPGEESA